LPTELRPPSGGTPPPDSIALPEGRVYLAPIAREAAARFWAEFPDEEERYGEAGFEWCVHDTQYLVAWSLQDATIGGGHFEKNLLWLARLLAARNYPLERIARDLEIAADVLEDRYAGAGAACVELRKGAATLRSSGATG
jgi:hypothetical protein